MSRLGHMAQSLALIAVIVQLFTPVIALRSSPSQTEQGIFAALFDAGLICHGAGSDQRPPSETPASPLPHHAGHAVCCPWHGNASPPIPTPITVEAIEFVWIGVAFAAPEILFIASRPKVGPGHVLPRPQPETRFI
jgi:hypothetical protein